MADPVTIVTNQNGWTKASGGSLTLAGKGDYNYLATGLPSATAGRTVLTSLAEANNLMLTAFGAGSAARAKMRIWAFNNIGNTASPQPVLGMFLADLEFTFGTTPYSGGVFGSTSYLPHTIEILDDSTNSPPGIRIVGATAPGEEALAALIFDSMGFSAFVIECENDGTPAANAGPIYRPI